MIKFFREEVHADVSHLGNSQRECILNLLKFVIIYIYIYIYKEREREREREIFIFNTYLLYRACPSASSSRDCSLGAFAQSSSDSCGYQRTNGIT